MKHFWASLFRGLRLAADATIQIEEVMMAAARTLHQTVKTDTRSRPAKPRNSIKPKAAISKTRSTRPVLKSAHGMGGRSRETGGMLLVSRVSAILKALQGQHVGMSLGQIADCVAFPRPTVQRLVDALKAEQLLAVDNANGGVRLGPELVRLAASVKVSVPDIARHHLETLGRAVNETVAMSVLRDGEANVLIQIPAKRDIRLTIEISAAWQLHTTADGLALLHGLPEQAVRKQFTASKKARPSRKTISYSDFRQSLAKVGRDGYAIDRERTTEGICAIAAGLEGLNGERYSISIIAPPARFEANVTSFRKELLACSAAINAGAGATQRRTKVDQPI